MSRTDRLLIGNELKDEIQECLRICKDPHANSEQKKQANDRVARFLQKHLFGVAVKQAKLDRDNGLSANDLFQTAFINLLKQFETPRENTPEDVESLCRAFCNLLYERAIDHLRIRMRKPAETLELDPESRPYPPDRGIRARESLLYLQKAVIWLDREHPELSAALKARFLVNPNVRFSEAGDSFSRFVHEQIALEKNRIFEEMGQLLSCTARQARDRYLRAVQLLKNQLPGFSPGDFTGCG